MMNVLITGGLGFIGSAITKAIAEKHRVIVLDKNDYDRSRHLHHSNINYVIGDICDQNQITEICKKENIDGVIHLAAVSRVIVAEQDPDECIRTNEEGVSNLLESLERTGQKPWLIFGSSREVYGEAADLPVKESAVKKPINIYGKSKLKGEQLFKDFAQKYKLSCAILRFSNVYGSRNDLPDRVLPRFIKAITCNEPLFIEGGGQVIDFTHISDTVHAIEKTIDYLLARQVIDDFHILPGIGWTLQQAIEFLEEITKRKARVKINSKRNYDVVRFIGDRSKSEKLLGLRPFLGLREGLEASIYEYCEVAK